MRAKPSDPQSASPPDLPAEAAFAFVDGRRSRPGSALRASVLATALALSAAQPALAQRGAQDGSDYRGSRALSLASSEEVEQAARQQYAQLKQEAARQGALAPEGHPLLERVQRISERLIPHALRFNPRARDWQWEVNVIGSKQINAFCMPGGKIAVFTGLIEQLKLTDDEIAVVIGHEMAHALLEHGREQVGKSRAAQWVTLGASVFSQILGYGNLGGAVANTGSQLLLLKYGREDESESDGMGLEIAARAGFDPRAALVLWRKMGQASGGQQQPSFLSTHPSHATRIRDIQEELPRVMPLYAQAIGMDVAALPAYGSGRSGSRGAASAEAVPRGSGMRGSAPVYSRGDGPPPAGRTPGYPSPTYPVDDVPRGAGMRGTGP